MTPRSARPMLSSIRRRWATASPVPRLALSSVVGVAAAIGSVPSALAFRTYGDDPAFAGAPLVRWATDAVELRVRGNAPDGLTTGATEDAARSAASDWNSLSCTGMELNLASTDEPAAPGDGRNTLEWVTSGWTDRGVSANSPAYTDVQFATNEDGYWEVVEAPRGHILDRWTASRNSRTTGCG